MAKIFFKRVQDSSSIDDVPIDDGSFIITKDGKLYIDYDEDRVEVLTPRRPAGIISEFAGSVAPEGYLMCDGSEVSRTTYSDLFEVIGTSYGSGNGSTTFNLPNLKGKVPVGYDSNDNDFNALGKTGGEKKHTLTTTEMPSHSHGAGVNKYFIVSWYGETYSYQAGGDTTNAVNRIETNTSAAGGSQPHNILQPYVVTNYIISY